MQVGVVDAVPSLKTVRVVINRLSKHPRYAKIIRHRTRLHVHDEQGTAQIGDRVEITECRPISRTKRWRVIRVLGRAGAGNTVSAPEATEVRV